MMIHHDSPRTASSWWGLIALLIPILAGCTGASFPSLESARTMDIASSTHLHLAFVGTLGDTTSVGSPGGLSLGLDGSLYICDRARGAVVRLDSTGVLLGRFGVFAASVDDLFSPVDISVSGSIEVYVLDGTRPRVVRLDRNLKNSSVVLNTPTGDPLFGSYAGIALASGSGDLYITDRTHGALLRREATGGIIETSGGFGGGSTSLREPSGIDVTPGGTIVIADTRAGAVGVCESFGGRLTFIGKPGLRAPVDIAVISGNLFVVADSARIALIDRQGTLVAVSDSVQTCRPVAVAAGNGTIYVSDAASGRVLVFRYTRK